MYREGVKPNGATSEQPPQYYHQFAAEGIAGAQNLRLMVCLRARILLWVCKYLGGLDELPKLHPTVPLAKKKKNCRIAQRVGVSHFPPSLPAPYEKGSSWLSVPRNST